MVEPKVRGWLYLIVGILGLWFTWRGNVNWAVYLLAASMVISGYHHAFQKHK